jgi:hypothetical protein
MLILMFDSRHERLGLWTMASIVLRPGNMGTVDLLHMC